MDKQSRIKTICIDVCIAVIAGIITGTAYHFFQNSNGFAPGGVSGLATITHHLIHNDAVSWSLLLLAFNLPIFILVSIFIDKKLGLILIVYISVQSLMPELYEMLSLKPYSQQNNPKDFNIIFACIATGVISGVGYSIMLRRFGASGGTYAISALIKKAKPEKNLAYVSFIMDASVVAIAFVVYDYMVTPTMCTLLNLFIANLIVDNVLSGVKNGYKFEIITKNPTELSAELLEKLKHGVTEIKVHGVYSDTDKYMLVCIINKKQVGEMMRILKRYPDTFSSFTKVNEVFGNFRRSV